MHIMHFIYVVSFSKLFFSMIKIRYASSVVFLQRNEITLLLYQEFFHGELIRWKSIWMLKQNYLLQITTFLKQHADIPFLANIRWLLKILFVIPVWGKDAFLPVYDGSPIGSDSLRSHNHTMVIYFLLTLNLLDIL